MTPPSLAPPDLAAAGLPPLGWCSPCLGPPPCAAAGRASPGMSASAALPAGTVSAWRSARAGRAGRGGAAEVAADIAAIFAAPAGTGPAGPAPAGSVPELDAAGEEVSILIGGRAGVLGRSVATDFAGATTGFDDPWLRGSSDGPSSDNRSCAGRSFGGGSGGRLAGRMGRAGTDVACTGSSRCLLSRCVSSRAAGGRRGSPAGSPPRGTGSSRVHGEAGRDKDRDEDRDEDGVGEDELPEDPEEELREDEDDEEGGAGGGVGGVDEGGGVGHRPRGGSGSDGGTGRSPPPGEGTVLPALPRSVPGPLSVPVLGRGREGSDRAPAGVFAASAAVADEPERTVDEAAAEFADVLPAGEPAEFDGSGRLPDTVDGVDVPDGVDAPEGVDVPEWVDVPDGVDGGRTVLRAEDRSSGRDGFRSAPRSGSGWSAPLALLSPVTPRPPRSSASRAEDRQPIASGARVPRNRAEYTVEPPTRSQES